MLVAAAQSICPTQAAFSRLQRRATVYDALLGRDTSHIAAGAHCFLTVSPYQGFRGTLYQDFCVLLVLYLSYYTIYCQLPSLVRRGGYTFLACLRRAVGRHTLPFTPLHDGRSISNAHVSGISPDPFYHD
jgi:hypothetical protein